MKSYRYREPYVLHTKCFTVDDDVAVFGSSNIDMRSFSPNLEVLVMLIGRAVREIDRIQAEYKQKSTLLTLEDWSGRTRVQRYVDNVARLTATLQ